MKLKSINECESQYLYLLKGIACFFVVFIHYGMFYMGGFYELTRVAVPIFFIIQGRFLSVQIDGKTTKECREKNSKTFIKLFKSTIFVSVMYILLSFYLWVVSNGTSFQEWFNLKFAPGEWLKLLVFNSSKVIYDYIVIFDHQWYLYATLTLIIVIIVLQKYINKHVLILFLIPLIIRLIDQYTFQIAKDGIWINGNCIEEMYLVRNFFFTGLPFLSYGMLLQYIDKEKITEFKCKVLKIILVTGSLCGVVLTYVEYIIWGSQELYIGSVLIAICITTIARFVDHNYKSILSWIGKCLSKDIYFWHPFIATVLINIFGVTIDWKIQPFVICICSVVFSLLILGARRLYERKKLFVN